MDKIVIAKRLLKMAKTLLAIEFPNQEAYDLYMKTHPKANKNNHSVKQTTNVLDSKSKEVKTPKTNQKPENTKNIGVDGKGGFTILKNDLIDIKVDGDLGNIGKWTAKVVLGNSGRLKKGEDDKVGYVAINTKGGDIIPIARSDEHQSGYELLYHLQKKGVISKASDYITLYNGNNYPDYKIGDKDEDISQYVDAVKKWLSYGGMNAPISRYSDRCVTDMEEFVSLGGKLPKQPYSPMKPAREMLNLAEGLKKDIDEGNNDAFSKAEDLAKKVDSFSYYVINDYDKNKKAMEQIVAAKKSNNIGALVEPLNSILDQWIEKGTKGSFGKDKFDVLFGSSDEAMKRIGGVRGGKDKTKKKDKNEFQGLKPQAQESIGMFEDVAKAGADVVGNPSAEKRFTNRAKGLIDHLKTQKIKIDKVEKLLSRAESDIERNDVASLQEHLFAFDGIKNLMHNYLRDLKKKGKKDDPYFGDVNIALEEFNRLGQI